MSENPGRADMLCPPLVGRNVPQANFFLEELVKHPPGIGAVGTAALSGEVYFLLVHAVHIPCHCAVQPPSKVKAAPVIFEA
jgi:hypothetical protein